MPVLRQQSNLNTFTANYQCLLIECFVSPASKVLNEWDEQKSRQFCFSLGLGNNALT